MDELPQRIFDSEGNCYAACIASITGISFDELKLDPPPTPAEANDAKYACQYYNRVRLILQENGWAILRAGYCIPSGFSIASGPSPRGDWDHAVVAKGRELVHDPHPSGAFIPRVDGYEVLIRIEGIEGN